MNEFLEYDKYGFIDKDASLEQTGSYIIHTKHNSKNETITPLNDELSLVNRLSTKGNGIARRRHFRQVKNARIINIVESCQKKYYLGQIKKSQKLDLEGNPIGMYITFPKNSKAKKQFKKLSTRKNRRVRHI